MAGPLQKKAEENETVQIRQFAGMLRDFDRTQYEFYRQFAKLTDNPSSAGISSAFSKAQAEFNVSFKKLTDFAVSHVPLMRRMLEKTLTETNINLDGTHLGLSDDDRKALKLIDGMKGTSYNLSYSSGLNPDGERALPHVELWVKTSAGMTPLFYFYYTGSEELEKTAGIAFVPSENIYNMVLKDSLNNKVPKKVE